MVRPLEYLVKSCDGPALRLDPMRHPVAVGTQESKVGKPRVARAGLGQGQQVVALNEPPKSRTVMG